MQRHRLSVDTEQGQVGQAVAGAEHGPSVARVMAMCRNIRPLHNYDPPTTEREIADAALQYVRKVSGMSKPARANEQAFARAVDAVASATATLLEQLVTTALLRDRALEIERARAAAERRFGPQATA